MDRGSDKQEDNPSPLNWYSPLYLHYTPLHYAMGTEKRSDPDKYRRHSDASSLWCQIIGECQNVSLHEQRHIPKDDHGQRISASNKPKQWIGNWMVCCAIALSMK